jgi:hypothetical protein
LPFPEETDFATLRSGLPMGVLTEPQLFPGRSSGGVLEAQAVLSIVAGEPGGRLAATRTANVRLAEAPMARPPSDSVQELPALPSGAHVQPAEELAGSKLASCGTVS